MTFDLWSRMFPGYQSSVTPHMVRRRLWILVRVFRGSVRRVARGRFTSRLFVRLLGALDQLAAFSFIGQLADRLTDVLSSNVETPMDMVDVLAIVRALGNTGVEFWLGGGWGVDALIGVQSRQHHDVDLVVADLSFELPAVELALATLGYRRWAAHEGVLWMPHTAVFEDIKGRRVEVLAVDWAILQAAAGLLDAGEHRELEDWRRIVFSSGSLGSQQVPCLSRKAQKLFHTGYVRRLKDVKDIAVLGSGNLAGYRKGEPATNRKFERSSLLIPVLDLPGPLRRIHESLGNTSLPPHITLLYPFAPDDMLPDSARSDLRHFFAEMEPIQFSLTGTSSFGDDVLYLELTPSSPFAILVSCVAEMFPLFPPYGAQYGEVIPHLTLGEGLAPLTMRKAERRAQRCLPVRTESDAVWLMAETAQGWEVDEIFKLEGPRSSELRSESSPSDEGWFR